MKEILTDEHWITAMHEGQFVRNNVWTFVPRPNNVNVIGTKWIFKINLMSMVLSLEIRQYL